MSATLFKEVSYSLSKLVEDIDMGEIGLPELQRPFVWENKKVRDLFDSMYKGFPVGYLLFWANGVSSGHRQIGATAKKKVPRLLIVDGQQRLTSLYAVLKGEEVIRQNYRREKINIAFRPRDMNFEVADAAIVKDPEYIPDISQLWSKNIARNRFVKDFFKRLRVSHEITEDQEDELTESIDRLFDLQNYPFTALELSPSVSEEQVSEVFVRVNSKGTTLNQADFILTLMSVFWDEGRAELEAFSRNSRQPATTGPSPFNYYIQPDPDQLLRVDIALGFRRARLANVYNVLRGKDLNTNLFSDAKRDEQFGILENAQTEVLDLQNWHEFLKAVRSAGYTGSAMITSENTLLYAYAFYLIGKRDFKVDNLRLRTTIARWFFMASITARYTGNVETMMEADLGRLRDAKNASEFINLLNSVIDSSLTKDFWEITLPNELATSSPRSPQLFSYYAALNLLGAKALFSNLPIDELLDPAIRAKKASVERHHLFPKNYLTSIGITDQRDTNQIANYALVEWDTNISISDAPPAQYYPKYAALYSSRKEELDQMCYWHALPIDWYNLNYRDFLERRRKAMSRIIEAGYKKLS